MHYETHVTVDNGLSFGAWEEFVGDLGAKALHLKLSGEGPKWPEQMMLAAKHEFPDDTRAVVWGANIADSVIGPVRLKVESELGAGGKLYYEAHWKFDTLRDLDAGEADIQRAVETGWFRHSRSLRYPWVHYLTARLFIGGHESARRHFDALGRGVRGSTSFAGEHYERVLVDTNPGLDDGWLPGVYK